MIYLSSTTNIPEQYRDCFGIMFSAKYRVGGLDEALSDGWRWMMDNNNFTGDFDAKTWIQMLLKHLSYKDSCIGIPIPDRLGNALETLRLFSRYHQIVKDLGYPVAFVTQDGITPEIAPWDYFDVLFVGGTDDHKLGPESIAMIAEAKARGKHIHIGRVNSALRIKRFWMADSVDGTFLTTYRRQKPNESESARDKRYLHRLTLLAEAVKYCRNKKNGHINPKGQYLIGGLQCSI